MESRLPFYSGDSNHLASTFAKGALVMTRVIGALKTENRESLDTLPEVQIVPRGVDKLFDSVNYEL